MEKPKTAHLPRNLPLSWICVFILVGILIAGLWPFTFLPQNQVEWLQQENGIGFHGRGLIYGVEDGVGVSSRSQSGESLTVELWLKPEIEPNRNLPVFLTLYDRHNFEAVTIGQWRSELIIRSKNLSTPLQFKEIGLENALSAGEKRFLAITFDGSRTTVFVDGKFKGQYPSNPLSTLDKNAMRFVLGNSPNGRDSWAGDLFALALYNRSLSPDEVARNYEGWAGKGLPVVSVQEGLFGLFTFTEKSGDRAGNQIAPEGYFRIPQYFQPLQKEILIPPWKDFQFKRSYLIDMAVNILGFIPFGFFFSIWFANSFELSARRAVLFTVFVSAVLSFSIELIQAWIPLRDSQVMDLLMNILGTSVGSLTFACTEKARRG
jgi:VanZ family protein